MMGIYLDVLQTSLMGEWKSVTKEVSVGAIIFSNNNLRAIMFVTTFHLVMLINLRLVSLDGLPTWYQHLGEGRHTDCHNPLHLLHGGP